MKIKKLNIAITMAVIIISACQSTNIQLDHKNIQSSTIKSQGQWDIEGKIAINIDNEGGSAGFSWTKNIEKNDYQEIELSGPLGIGRVMIKQQANQATLINKNKQTYYDNNIDNLLLSRIHWPIPFNDISEWVSSWRNNESGLDETTTNIHKNWNVEIKDTKEYENNLYPRKVFFTAKPEYREYVGNYLTKAYDEGYISKPEFNLPPEEIIVKIIFSSIK